MSNKKLNLEISVNSIKLVGAVLLTVVILLIIIFTGIKSFNSGENPSSADNEITEVYRSLSPQAQALYYKQSEELTKPVAARLVELDQKTIGCFGPSSIMDMSDNEENLGGQCCGALTDAEAYELQMVALEKFIDEHGSSDLIPSDPYDVTVKQAKKLTAYDEIELSSDQQKIYDDAMEMSHHGGPCCCKCWKWYMMSGLAKRLITEYDWNEHDIAELWDLSSSCGHSEDTNMHEHYSTDEEEVDNHDSHNHSH